MSWVATAIVASAVIGGVVSSKSSKKAASAQTQATQTSAKVQTEAARLAAEAQLEATRLGIAEQRRQFDFAKDILDPYVASGLEALPQFAPFQEAGAEAFQGQLDLAGLGDPQAQGLAIARLAQSPRFNLLMEQGEKAMLQRASATGGLRGGNLQSALAQFRPALLNQIIEEQYARLGGLSATGLGVTSNLLQTGQASAAGVGSAALGTGSAVSGLLADQGTAAANRAMNIGNVQSQAAMNIGAAQAANARAQGGAFAGAAQAIPQALMMGPMYGGFGGSFGGGGAAGLPPVPAGAVGWV